MIFKKFLFLTSSQVVSNMPQVQKSLLWAKLWLLLPDCKHPYSRRSVWTTSHIKLKINFVWKMLWDTDMTSITLFGSRLPSQRPSSKYLIFLVSARSHLSFFLKLILLSGCWLMFPFSLVRICIHDYFLSCLILKP